MPTDLVNDRLFCFVRFFLSFVCVLLLFCFLAACFLACPVALLLFCELFVFRRMPLME